MSFRSTFSTVALFAAIAMTSVASAKSEKEPTPLPEFSNRTMHVLHRVGIFDMEGLLKAYQEGGHRKFANLAGLGNKGLKEIEDAVGAWSGDPEMRPLMELGLSTKVIVALELIDNTRNLQDLKAVYQKYGFRLKTMNRLGESGLKEIQAVLNITDSPAEVVLEDSTNITTVGLSNRVTNSLWHKGVRTFGELKQLYAEHGRGIKDVPGLGPKCLTEIENFLGVDPDIGKDEPKLSARTKGKLNQLHITSVEQLKDRSLLWFQAHFREKGVEELLSVLKERYELAPYKDEFERAIHLKLWDVRLDSEAMNVNYKTLKFMGIHTVGELYNGYKVSSSEFLRYEQQYDPNIRTRIETAEGYCENLLK